jgi:hypothetical protein
MDTFENENNQEDFEVEEQESIVQEANIDPYSNERGTVLKIFLNKINNFQQIACLQSRYFFPK